MSYNQILNSSSFDSREYDNIQLGEQIKQTTDGTLLIDNTTLDLKPRHIVTEINDLPVQTEDDSTKLQVIIKYDNGHFPSGDGTHDDHFCRFSKITPQFFDSLWQNYARDETFDPSIYKEGVILKTIAIDNGMFLQKFGDQIVFKNIDVSMITDFITYLEANYFTQTEIIDFEDAQNIEIEDGLNLKRDITDSYSIAETDALLNLKANTDTTSLTYYRTTIDDNTYIADQLSYYSTTLAIAMLYYDKTYIDSNIYTKTQQDITDGNQDTQINLRLLSSDVSNYNTNIKIDNALFLYILKTDLSLYNTNSLLTAALNLKLDSSAISSYNTNALINSALALYILKTDLSLYNTNSLLTAALNLKGNLTYIDSQDANLQSQITAISSNPSNSYNGLSGKPNGVSGIYWMTNSSGVSVTNKLNWTLSDIDPLYFLFIKDSANTFTSNDLLLSLRKTTFTNNDDVIWNIASAKSFKILQATSLNKIEFTTANDINIQTIGSGDDINLNAANNLNLIGQQVLCNPIGQVLFTPGSDFGVQLPATGSLLIQTPSLAAYYQLTNADINNIYGQTTNITGYNDLNLNSSGTTADITLTSGRHINILTPVSGGDIFITAEDEIRIQSTGSSNSIQINNHNAQIKVDSASEITLTATTGNILLINTTGAIELVNHNGGIFLQGDWIQFNGSSNSGFTSNIQAEFISNSRSVLSFWNNTTRMINFESDSGTATASAIWDNRYSNSMNSTYTHQLRYVGTQITRYNNVLNTWVTTSSVSTKNSITDVIRDQNLFFNIPFRLFRYNKQSDQCQKKDCGIIIEEIQALNQQELTDLVTVENEIDDNGQEITNKFFHYRGFANLCLSDVQKILINQRSKINEQEIRIRSLEDKLKKVCEFLNI